MSTTQNQFYIDLDGNNSVYETNRNIFSSSYRNGKVASFIRGR